MAKATKDPVVITVFSLGAILGLICWGAIPAALFTLGKNDSNLASLLAFACFFLFMPLCFLAFWKLRLAGFGFLLLAIMWTTSLFCQYHLEKSRGRLGAPYDLGMLIYNAGFLFFGVFALRADRKQSLVGQASKPSSGTELL